MWSICKSRNVFGLRHQ
jgi:hypothetical protein